VVYMSWPGIRPGPASGDGVTMSLDPAVRPGPASAEFTRLAQPLRRELLAYCYRMLGSADEAEDLVQETYLRAWRSYGGFEGRSSFRVWLYRIATTACLTAIDRRRRRPLPSGLVDAAVDVHAPLAPPDPEAVWLQPLPADPATVVAARGTLRLALVAAMQMLTGRQRAVLILRDVLGWRAAEVAGMLGMSVPAVHSALQRARIQLAALAPDEDEMSEPSEAASRIMLDRYVAAFETADMDSLLSLLTEQVRLEMPPYTAWFTGRETVVRFLTTRHGAAGIRMVPTVANGQPAFAAYAHDADGVPRPQALHVLTLTSAGISHVVAFLDPELVVRFGPLPAE
jgi:RNA polymerase sigma-70 factor (ECF subfamily)